MVLDSLIQIEIENPEYFHRNYNLNKIQKNNIKIEYLKIKNPDKKIAKEVLKSLSKKQVELLELYF